MALEELHWVDWVGLTLATYGVVAGAVRGLTQQFSRCLTWGVAVLFAGAASPFCRWGAELLSEDAVQTRALSSWFQLALLVFALLFFGSIRRYFLARLGNASTLADRLLGTLSGAATAALIWLIVIGTAMRAAQTDGLQQAKSFEFSAELSSYYRKIPASLQTNVFGPPLRPRRVERES